MISLDPITGHPTTLRTSTLQLLLYYAGEGQSIIRGALQDLDRTNGSYVWTQNAIDECNNLLDGLLPNFLSSLIEAGILLPQGSSHDSHPSPT